MKCPHCKKKICEDKAEPLISKKLHDQWKTFEKPKDFRFETDDYTITCRFIAEGDVLSLDDYDIKATSKLKKQFKGLILDVNYALLDNMDIELLYKIKEVKAYTKKYDRLVAQINEYCAQVYDDENIFWE